jgi:dihydropteroate synthase
VGDDEELRRILPVIEGIKRESDVKLSVDTTKARVARRAIAAGADMVNDVSALADPGMLPSCERRGAGGGDAHARHAAHHAGRHPLRGPALLRGRLPPQGRRPRRRRRHPDDKVLVDPGLGFGKSSNGNLEILRQLETLRSIGRPILIGASRKSFIGAVLDLPGEAAGGGEPGRGRARGLARGPRHPRPRRPGHGPRRPHDRGHPGRRLMLGRLSPPSTSATSMPGR